MNKYIFLDTETSGLDWEEDRICQLSYMVTDSDLNILEAKNFYFYLEHVDTGASRVHGLTPDILLKLSGGKVFRDFAKEIQQDLKDSVVVCHNVDFDLNFLEQEFKRIGVEDKIYEDCFCTMQAYTNILKLPHPYYCYKYPKLEEVVYYLGIQKKQIKDIINKSFKESTGFHDARYDVTCTYLAYKKYLDILLED